jgi:hypothetical protein
MVHCALVWRFVYGYGAGLPNQMGNQKHVTFGNLTAAAHAFCGYFYTHDARSHAGLIAIKYLRSGLF